jgi:hypothetical protein
VPNVVKLALLASADTPADRNGVNAVARGLSDVGFDIEKADKFVVAAGPVCPPNGTPDVSPLAGREKKEAAGAVVVTELGPPKTDFGRPEGVPKAGVIPNKDWGTFGDPELPNTGGAAGSNRLSEEGWPGEVKEGWGGAECVGMECLSKALLNGAGTSWEVDGGNAIVGAVGNVAEAVGLGPNSHPAALGLRGDEEGMAGD